MFCNVILMAVLKTYFQNQRWVLIQSGFMVPPESIF